jgi:hypothetical protein
MGTDRFQKGGRGKALHARGKTSPKAGKKQNGQFRPSRNQFDFLPIRMPSRPVMREMVIHNASGKLRKMRPGKLRLLPRLPFERTCGSTLTPPNSWN